MGVFAAILTAIVGIFFLAWIISGLFMLFAARLSAVEGATLGKAMLAAFGCSFITWLCAALCSVIPVVGTAIGAILGVLVSIFVITGIFNTSFSRGFLVWLFNALGQFVAVIIAVLTFAGAIFGVGSQVVSTATQSLSSDQSPSASTQGTIQDARRLAAALEAYATDLNAYPSARSTHELEATLVPRYIRAIPEGLQVQSGASGYSIRSSTGEELLTSGSPTSGR